MPVFSFRLSEAGLMAAVVGHVLGAFIAARGAERAVPNDNRNRYLPWILPAFLSVAPDLDVIFVVLTPGSVVHRGGSHSILVAIVLSLMAAGIWKLAEKDTPFLKLWAVTFAASFSHLIMDWLMGCGPKVKFLWPLTIGDWLCPIQLIPTSFYAQSFRGVLVVLTHPYSLRGMAMEASSLFPLLLIFYTDKLGVKICLGFMSFAGFLTTMLFYNWN